MPLVVVSVGRLAMKFLVYASGRDPNSASPLKLPDTGQMYRFAWKWLWRFCCDWPYLAAKTSHADLQVQALRPGCAKAECASLIAPYQGRAGGSPPVLTAPGSRIPLSSAQRWLVSAFRDKFARVC